MEIKHLKALKEKWLVKWAEFKEVDGKNTMIQCQAWFNREQPAKDFTENYSKQYGEIIKKEKEDLTKLL